MRNVPWNEEEEILLVSLYFELKAQNIGFGDADSQIDKLSLLLNKRAKMLKMETSKTFRNVAGIKMKLQKVRYVDTDGKIGLSATSEMDRSCVERYKHDPTAFNELADSIRIKYSDK